MANTSAQADRETNGSHESDSKRATRSPSSGDTADLDHPILFFDGVCGLCNRSVDFVLPRDRAGVFRFSPLQGETARRLLGVEDRETPTTIVLLDEAGMHRRSTAVVRLLRRLGGVWKLYGNLLCLVPKPLRDLGYRMISSHRYRLFGKRETCRMPSPEERDRFLP